MQIVSNREHLRVGPVQLPMRPRLRDTLAVLAIILVGTVGCTSARKNARINSLDIPTKIQFAQPDSPGAPIRLKSGQMVELPHCCPPLELRNANGETVQEFDIALSQVRLVAQSGIYSLVAYDPGGGEHAVQIIVTGE